MTDSFGMASSEAGPSRPRRRPPVQQPRTIVTSPPLIEETAESPDRIHWNAWGARPEREVVRPPSRFISLAEEARMSPEERAKLKRPYQKSAWEAWKGASSLAPVSDAGRLIPPVAIPPRRRQALAIVGLITCYLELYVFHTEEDLEEIRQKPRPRVW
jgi:hypothetical protein